MKETPDYNLYEDEFSSAEDSQGISIDTFRGGRNNPYIYVRLAFRHLSFNRFEEARGMMERAKVCGGLLFTEGSMDAREFKLEIQMLRVMILYLTDKFGRLPDV